MGGAIVLCHKFSEWRLIVLRALVLAKTQRDGAQAAPPLCRKCHERRRIEARGEEYPDGHIRDEVVANGIQKRCAKALMTLFGIEGGRGLGSSNKLASEAEKMPWLMSPCPIYP